MRERTTWNRADIQKRASAMSRQAEDPRAMNQDHLQRQPSADKYLTGDPSTFAEDVHPSGKNWKSEYSDGSTARNEIGMPEMRDDTFNHPETDPGSSPARGGGSKAAALDEETLVKKADVCCKVARRMLGKNASEAAIEDQALALMNLSDSDLIATATRMANQDQGQDEQGQEKQAQDQDQGQEQDQGKQAQDQGQDDQGQKQAQGKKELPPEFLENIQKKKDEAKDKEARAKLVNLEQLSSQLQQLAQQVQQMMQSQQQMPQQAQQQVQQEQVQQEQVQQAQEQMSNDQMIDQMLAQGQPQQQAPMANDFGVQMDSPAMDIGEAQMGPEDDVLATLFANNQEVQNAQTAHQLQHGTPAPMQVQASQPMGRTAATRTVGTRPTGGVSQLGGLGSSAPASGGDVDKLSNLWNSAPDVSDVFRS